MKTYGRKLISVTVIAILAVVGSVITNSRPAVAENPKQPDPVTIVGPIPLPVTGSTTIAGTPNVNVSNSPTVNLTPGSSVLVGNPASNPVPIMDVNHAMQPVQAGFVNFSILNGQIFGFTTLYTVGASKRLVIEYVSIYCSLPANQVLSGFVATVVGGVSAAHLVPNSPAAIVPQPITTANAGGPVRLYADPGTSVSVQASRQDNVGLVICFASFSGQLVNL
jgi:hypothetical protein